MPTIIEVTSDTFATEVLASDKPVLVDFWADWCMPCKQLSPILDELATSYDGRVKFAKVDTSVNIDLAASQGVLSLPTVQMYVGGQLVNQLVGAKPKSVIAKALDEYL
ncbi:MAG: thioredoxin [Propionibacteriaceae bacterium]|jgi:thioredoxin 1|nr:thioredoxin [Propionibacteriaceae bacterium]